MLKPGAWYVVRLALQIVVWSSYLLGCMFVVGVVCLFILIAGYYSGVCVLFGFDC